MPFSWFRLRTLSWADSEAFGISDRLAFAKNMRSDVPGLSSIRSLLIALTMLLAPMPLTMTWARQLPSARADVPDLDPRQDDGTARN